MSARGWRLGNPLLLPISLGCRPLPGLRNTARRDAGSLVEVVEEEELKQANSGRRPWDETGVGPRSVTKKGAGPPGQAARASDWVESLLGQTPPQGSGIRCGGWSPSPCPQCGRLGKEQETETPS